MSRGKQIRKNMLSLPKQEKRANVCIAVTAINGTVCCGIPEALMEWAFAREFDFTVNFYPNEKPLDSARNIIINDFLSEKGKDFTHLCFIDDDIRPRADTMTKLLAADKEAICPLIFSLKNTNGINEEEAIQPVPLIFERINEAGDMKINTKVEGVARTSNLAGGFMLIKRHVIEEIEKPAFHYRYKPNGVVCGGTDTIFSEKIEKLGYELYVDTSSDVDQMIRASIISFNNTLIDCAEKFSGKKYAEVAYD